MNNYDYSILVDDLKMAMSDQMGYVPVEIIADGQIHRYSTDSKNPLDKAGWYTVHFDVIPNAVFGNYRTGYKGRWKWNDPNYKTPTPEQRKQQAQQIEATKQAKKKQLDEQHKKSRQESLVCWRSGITAPSSYPYLLKKNIRAYDTRISTSDKHYKGWLMTPCYDVWGRLQTIQFISPIGEKRFLKGSTKHGGFWSLTCDVNHLPKYPRVIIVEGLATGATVAEIEANAKSNSAVVVAFGANNVMSVVDALLGRFPDLPIELIPDNDRKNERDIGVNTGIVKAEAVAKKYPNIIVRVPTFPDDAPIELSDVNDLVNWQQSREGMK